MKKPASVIIFFLGSIFLFVSCNQSRIDRKALVDRHRIVSTETDPRSPAQVGNGEFAFGVDITGLQTFVPFNTMAQWSWHSFPLPEGQQVEDFKKPLMDTYGRQIPYDIPNPEQPELSAWLAANPHRFNLGRIGFKLLRADGSAATAGDLSDTRQEVDMWTNFAFEHPALIGTFGMLPGMVSIRPRLRVHWRRSMQPGITTVPGDGISRCWLWLPPGAVNPIKRSTSCSIRQVGSSLMNMGWQQAALSLISRLTVLCLLPSL